MEGSGEVGGNATSLKWGSGITSIVFYIHLAENENVTKEFGCWANFYEFKKWYWKFGGGGGKLIFIK